MVSLDHDGEAFHQLCLADPVLAQVHARAPGFRPALFYSPYEAAVWSIISARRARSQGITLRTRMSEQYGASFELSGPARSAYRRRAPPADRVAARDYRQTGSLGCMPSPRPPSVASWTPSGCARCLPEEAQAELQQLPGIGPFYSSLIVIRACGHADVPSLGESRSRAAVQQAYGIDHDLSDAELLAMAETWRPFRTWVSVMMRALAS